MRRRRIGGHVRAVKPLVQHDVRQHRDLDTVLAQTDEEIPVLGVAVARIETIDLLEDVPPDHRRDELDAAELAVNRIPFQLGHVDAVLDDPLLPPEHAARRRVIEEIAGLGPQLGRGQQVVVVKECDQIALRFGESGVPRGWEPLVRLVDIAKQEGVGDLGRPILGAIVDEDDLEGLEVLCE